MIVEALQTRLEVIDSFDRILPVVLGVFESVTSVNPTRIGYVAGIITSDGPDNIDRNIRELLENTNRLRLEQEFPIFSAPDIFTKSVYRKINESGKVTEGNFIDFWDKVLRSGYVTDIFMTPRWDASRGAVIEHFTAEDMKLHIHYLNKK